MRILVVEDELKMAGLLKRGLEEEGYAVDVAATGADAIWAATENPYDAILLDVLLPDMNGFEVCRRLRAGGRWAPVLMLTARDAVADRVAGLDAGADDYLTKPFSPRELMARIRTLLRRSSRGTSGPAERRTRQIGRIGIDLVGHHVTLDGVRIECTRGEFAILAAMSEQPDRVFTRAQLLHHTRGIDRSSTERTIDVHVANLRRKIEADSRRPVQLLTVHGVGYKLAPA